MSVDLKNLELPELEKLVELLGAKKYLAGYIFRYIHQQLGCDIDKITSLSKSLRTALAAQKYYISTFKSCRGIKSANDGTAKYVFELSDGNIIESVLMRDKDRLTACVSSQAGCRFGCSFCATGRLQFRRNLTAGEIIEQVYQISRDAGEKLNNVVYMGMGEPLDNYDNTLRAIRILAHPYGCNIGIRRHTISTVGIIPCILRLAKEDIHPRLAVSLHSPYQHQRVELMPIAARHPLDELINALGKYQHTTGRRITIEYCMIKRVNDSLDAARDLAALLKGIDAYVNLIEYNRHEGADYQPAEPARIRAFRDILIKSGFKTIIRYRRGRDIKAACGQLGAERIEQKIIDE